MDKKTKRRFVNWSITMLIFLVTLGCVSPFYSSSPSAAPAPGSFETMIVQTANAAFTQTALHTSPTATVTDTPIPSNTPTETPTATSTVVFIISTWTPIPSPTIIGGELTGKDYSCSILSVSPRNSMDPQTDFDAKWTVKNTGNKTWDRNSVDYAYSSGQQMHKKSVYDLPENVDSEETITLIVDMIAPKKAGTYNTFWVLRRGSTNICKMGITVVVK